MTQQLQRPAVRRAILAALLVPVLALALWASAPTPADAASNCTYYSNASHTTVVGRFGRDCCNNQVAWGVKTQFSVCSSACLICYPPPPF